MYEIKISKVYSEPYLVSFTQLIYEFAHMAIATLHIKNKILRFWRYIIGYFLLVPHSHSTSIELQHSIGIAFITYIMSPKKIHMLHEHSTIRDLLNFSSLKQIIHKKQTIFLYISKTRERKSIFIHRGLVNVHRNKHQQIIFFLILRYFIIIIMVLFYLFIQYYAVLKEISIR